MTISLHTIEAQIGATVIPIKSASIQLDETWSPYVQASFETPLNNTLLNLLDPRFTTRVQLYATQKYGISEKLSVLSSTFGGGTIATVTAAWTGDSLADISESYFTPYNTSGVNYNYRRRFDLTLRSRTVNVQDANISVSLSSDEALLQDYALVSDIIYTPSVTNVRGIISYVLGLTGNSLQPGAADGTIEPESSEWLPGQSAWDYLSPLVQATGLRLYCDEKRLWYLVEADYTASGTVTLDATETITGANDTISRDDDNWYDAVVITYRWVNALGETVLAYDTASVEGFSRVLSLEYNSAYPGAGAAAAVLARAQQRGRINDVQAVSDYRVIPSQAFTLELPGFTTQTGYISSVQWNYPADEMNINTREATI